MTVNKHSQGNIRTAFRTYISCIEQVSNLKPIARKHLKALNSKYGELLNTTAGRKDIPSIITSLSSIIHGDGKAIKLNRRVIQYVQLKNSKDARLLQLVATNLRKGMYYEMAFRHFNATAKVLAIKSHLNLVKSSI